MKRFAVIAALTLAACHDTATAPRPTAEMSPPVQASVIRYDPDCNWSTIFWLQEPQKTAIYLFEPGAVVDDTVQPGTYDVGYAELDGTGTILGGDRRLLVVDGVTVYSMRCEP